jgi:hypothetical protein
MIESANTHRYLPLPDLTLPLWFVLLDKGDQGPFSHRGSGLPMTNAQCGQIGRFFHSSASEPN